MGKYPLPLGAWGRIRVEELGTNRGRARAKYRDLDGITRLVEARGGSRTAAQRALQIRLQQRQTPRNSLLAPTSKISQLAEVFLIELDRSDKVSRTKDKYSTTVRK